MAGLDRTLRYVWPCDERGIPEERYAPAAHHRGFEIADWLEERLRGRPHDFRKDRWEQRLGIAPQRRNHFLADEVRRNSLGVDVAGGVGLHLGERGRGVDGAVPDEAVTPAPGGEVVKSAGRRITKDVLAIEEAPSEAVEDSSMGGWRERCFLNHSAPADVAGIDQIDLGEHLPARRRANAVSGDEHISVDLRTIGQSRSHALMILGEAG